MRTETPATPSRSAHPRGRASLARPAVVAALVLLLGTFVLAVPATARDAPPPSGAPEPDARELLGRWVVDLRSTPEAEPYSQPMEVTAVANGKLQGMFYGSEIIDGRVTTSWGAVRFAFRTRDGGGGLYHHSGLLVGGRLEGMSHGIDRDFLLPWRAARKDEEATAGDD